MKKIFMILALAAIMTTHTAAEGDVIFALPPPQPISRAPYERIVNAEWVDLSIQEPLTEKHVVSGIITAYCSCSKCCGQYSAEYNGGIAITTTGTIAEAGRTVAVNPNVIPYGAHVWIDGHEYIAEDTGSGLKDGVHVDIYCDSHVEALRIGRQTKEISWQIET